MHGRLRNPFLMVIALDDNSAVRIAAHAAIWTGWNVLTAMIYIGRKRHYVVTREDGPI
jgi:hypothetical protein